VFFIETERGANASQEISQLIDLYESSSLWIEVRPLLSECGIHIIVEESRLLDLSVIIALQDHCNKELQENKGHNKVVTCKESIGQGPRGASHRYISSLSIVLVGRILDTLIENTFLHNERGLESVPRVSSGHHEQHHEGVYEILEIHPIIHQSCPHLSAEEDHSKNRIHVDDEKQECANVDEGLKCNDKGVEDHVQVLPAPFEQSQDSQDSERSEECHCTLDLEAGVQRDRYAYYRNHSYNQVK
jgi:hypothetical protein